MISANSFIIMKHFSVPYKNIFQNFNHIFQNNSNVKDSVSTLLSPTRSFLTYRHKIAVHQLQLQSALHTLTHNSTVLHTSTRQLWSRNL